MPVRIERLCPEPAIVFRSPCPQKLYAYSPSLCRLPDGTLLASLDLGVAKSSGALTQGVPGRILRSDDGGEHWSEIWRFPFIHARLFSAGRVVYLLGHMDGACGDIAIIRSDDMGRHWSAPALLTAGQHWHQASSNVLHANGCVYLAMERAVYDDCSGWNVSTLAPVLMRARAQDDLTQSCNWTFASEIAFRDLVDANTTRYIGIPFYRTEARRSVAVCRSPVVRKCAPIGWLEAQVVQFHDPDHIWCDSAGHTFHLWMRAHTGCTGYAAVLKVVENPDGSMTTLPETVPSGRPLIWLPCPGGQMKFHIEYDPVSALYWLLSTQATDSMRRPERMSPRAFGLPDNERQRLVLHFSRNCVDWCFAGLVDAAVGENASCHYGYMLIDRDDLLIVSRSGDGEAFNAHNGNLITFHRVRNFRSLIY